MQFPYLAPTPQSRVTTDRFRGYDHRLRIPDGAFYETRNLSSRDYPLLSTRRPRGLVRTLTAPGGLIAKDALITVEDGTLCVNGLPTALTGLAPGDKQLVSMGAYVLVFPDKRYYNTEDAADFGSMEAELQLSGDYACTLCTLEGEPLPAPTVSATEPADPVNGALWLDPGGGGKTLRCYSAASGVWAELESVYVRVDLPSYGQLPRAFKALDGVTLTGVSAELDGEKILYALGGGETERDYLVLAGLIEAPFSGAGTVTLRRSVPDMDYVCEAGNRLWGCRYGSDGSRVLNEIYASALGDFRNFRQYLGLATDSWTASLGSDGPFTGAVNYLGRPTFFKEDRIHQVTISASGAHRLEETPCRGVQRGSAKSLCVVGESLYYKSGDGVCVWQGGFPRTVSAPLGEERYDSAAAGALGERYYLSMRNSAAGAWCLFCYDAELDLWYREDELHAAAFAALDGELYALEAESGRLWALQGSAGEIEGDFDWMAETGLLHYRSSDRKYLSRYNLSLRMEPGAELHLWLRYDSAGDWMAAGELRFSGTGTLTLPIRPRRCDHLQLRITGRGQVRIFALTRVLEIGSDVGIRS